ncbi:MAG: alpha-L-arabinofuranosidase C-terminal domain-containing protein [Pirellulales bacterium]
MKRHLLLAVIRFAVRALLSASGVLLAPIPIHAAESYSATVRVTDRVLNTVKPLLFGDNIEWTNDGMGFWLSKEKKLDEKLIAEVRAAGVTHLRYPGGTLSDYFDWSKAIGERRQPIPNPFAKGKPEDPRFGPAEFIELCRKLDIPGTITLNAGTATPEDAAGWVKYFRDQRFPVTAFAVGNEIYMAKPTEPIVKTPEQYIDFYLKCREAIDKVAPGTKLGVIGLHDTGAFSLSQHKDWMEKVLRALGDKISFIDVHNGYAPVARIVVGDPKAKAQPDDEFAACFLGASVYVEENLRATKADLAKYAPQGGKNVEIHITEYGPLVYPLGILSASEELPWNRSLAGALYQACLFNVFAREPKLTSANHLPLHQDVFGALVGVHSALFFGQTNWRNIVFHVFQMYSKMAGREVLAAEVQSPTYSTAAVGIVPKLENVPYLDAGAYRTPDGKKLTLFLINRDVRRNATVKLDLERTAWRTESMTTLSADSYKAENGPSQPDRVVPVTTAGDDRTSVELPKHSLLRIDLGKK